MIGDTRCYDEGSFSQGNEFDAARTRSPTTRSNRSPGQSTCSADAILREIRPEGNCEGSRRASKNKNRRGYVAKVREEERASKSLQPRRARTGRRYPEAPESTLSGSDLRPRACERVGVAGCDHSFRTIHGRERKPRDARTFSEISHGSGFRRAHPRATRTRCPLHRILPE